MKITHSGITAAFALFHVIAGAQDQDKELSLPQPRRFIDKVEVFAGAGVSFNYGNIFVENYKDESIENKRLLKVVHTVGVGIYHPLTDRIHLVGRAQYDRKGSKADLSLPVYMGRLNICSEYTYSYLTLGASSGVLLGRRKNLSLSIGATFSRIQSVKGYEKVFNSRDNIITEGHFEGRSIRTLDDDGAVIVLTFIPGLKSFEKHDYGLVLGCDYLFKVSSNWLSIGVRDNFGISNINKPDYNNPAEKNHLLEVIVGYVFQRKNK